MTGRRLDTTVPYCTKLLYIQNGTAESYVLQYCGSGVVPYYRKYSIWALTALLLTAAAS